MATITTTTSAAAWRPDQFALAPEDVLPDALILQTSTIAGSVDGDAPSLRVAWTNDGTSNSTPEAALIAASGTALAEAVIFTTKVSWRDVFSNEQYGQLGSAERIAASASRSLTRKANAAYVGNLVGPAGLLRIPGTVNGGLVGTSLDALTDLIATLEHNEAVPSHIVADPYAWADLAKLKVQAGSNSSLLGAGTEAAQLFLNSIPVIKSAQMAKGTALVIDKNNVVSAVGPVMVAASEHEQFSNDAVVARGTWRIGWQLPRANRLGWFHTASGADYS